MYSIFITEYLNSITAPATTSRKKLGVHDVLVLEVRAEHILDHRDARLDAQRALSICISPFVIGHFRAPLLGALHWLSC